MIEMLTYLLTIYPKKNKPLFWLIGSIIIMGNYSYAISQFSKPLGIYEVAVDYSQKNWKQQFKTTFLVVQTDSIGEKVELYHIIIDSSKSLNFDKNKVHMEYHKRSHQEVIFLGKCTHVMTKEGIVNTADIHSAKFDYHKVTTRQFPNYQVFICPLDLYFYGMYYKNGGHNLDGKTAIIMPLSTTEIIKDKNNNIKRSVNKLPWSESFVQDFNKLSDFVFKKSELVKDIPNNYVYKTVKNQRNVQFKIDSNSIAIHNEIDSLFDQLGKGRLSFYNEDLRKRSLLMEQRTISSFKNTSFLDIQNSILQGGNIHIPSNGIAGYIGYLIDIMTNKETTDVLHIKNRLQGLENEIMLLRQNLDFRKTEKIRWLKEISNLKQKKSTCDSLIVQLNDFKLSLIQRFVGKKYLIDSNFSFKKGETYDSVFIFDPGGTVVNIYKHVDSYGIIKSVINKSLPDVPINNFSYVPIAMWNETVFEDIGKMRLKIELLNKLIERVRFNLKDNSYVNNLDNIRTVDFVQNTKDKIQAIEQDLLRSNRNIQVIKVSVDNDLSDLLKPVTSNGANKFYNEMRSSYKNGQFTGYSSVGSWSGEFIKKYRSDKRPLLLMEGFKYSLPASIIDSMFNDVIFSSFIDNTGLLNSISSDSTVRLLKKYRNHIVNDSLNSDIVSVSKYGRIINLNNEFNDLRVALNSLLKEVEVKRDSIQFHIEDIQKSRYDLIENDEYAFIKSTEEFSKQIKLNDEDYESLHTISIEKILKNAEDKGIRYTMNEIDTLYNIANNQYRAPSETIRLKELEYNRVLSDNEISLIYRKDIERVTNQNKNDRIENSALLHKFRSSLARPLNDSERSKILESSSKVVNYLLKSNCKFSESDLAFLPYLSRLITIENEKMIDTQQVVSKLYNDIISDRTIYVKKYPFNPILLKYDSIMLEEKEILVKYLQSFFLAVKDERLTSIIDYNNIETNIPSINATDIYEVRADWVNSKGNSSLWKNSSQILKNITMDYFLHVPWFDVGSRWGNISYDYITKEWILHSGVDDRYVHVQGQCDQCCTRMGFRLDGNSITISSFFVFTDCY